MFGLTCRDVSEEASRYIDGELPLHRRLAFRLHLALCGACTTFVSQIRLVRDTLPSIREDAALKESTRASLMEEFERREP